ncbi:MAG: S1/P1 nuclease [Verrucomicrobiota bacterium]|nr:S1/P1 nuclease [Verrucomicrobiota bacterium]
MNTYLKTGLLSVLCAVGTSFRTLAWGPEGHEIIAELALYYVTPTARMAIDEILGDYKLGEFDIASWPDIIRGNKEYTELYPQNGRWHYIDLDVGQRYDENFQLDVSEDGNDIVCQIYRWRDGLASDGLKGERRLDALRFLVHFVGDIHQPLHCAYRYGDMGGNMLPVNSFQGRHFSFDADSPQDYPPSLHSIWDSSMVNEAMDAKKVFTYVKKLQKEITPEDITRWNHDDVLKWATENYWISRKEIYRWTDGERVPFTWRRPGMDITPENYIDSHLSIVHQQMKKGGIRLAHMLNTAFDPDYEYVRVEMPRPSPKAETEE